MDIGARCDVWSLPGALLWLPTAVNGFLAVEIVQLWWQRRHGGYNTAQGDFAVGMHIAAASLPIAALLIVGAVALLILRRAVGRSAGPAGSHGVYVLLAVNIAAPVVLYYGLKWLA